MNEPFGALRPSPFQDRLRALGERLPRNYLGRKAASLLLGPAGGRAARAYDVAVFGSEKARLHPFDNICEKRVYLTPQMWEFEERQILGDLISGHRGRSFDFLDVGANAGLYTLFACAQARKAGVSLKAVCIEADPEMAKRLQFNVFASSAAEMVRIFNCAASDREGDIRFTVNQSSRGLSRVDPDGEMLVAARPLSDICAEAGLQKIDAMKIDIEGHEFAALGAFFRDASASLRPSLIILEISHQPDVNATQSLLADAGYVRRFATRRNAVFADLHQMPT